MKKLFVLVMAFALIAGMSGLVLADNEADIEQTGVNNAEALIEQIGDNLDADIIQGYGGYMEIKQDGIDHFAKIDSTGYNGGGDIDVFIDQLDEGHNAEVDLASSQMKEYGLVDILQEGLEQDAWVRLRNPSENFDIDIDQDGEDNVSNVDVGHGETEVNISQDGIGNMADVWTANWNNSTDLEQTGDDNEVFITQKSNYGELHRAGGEALIEQIGDENTINLAQTSRPAPWNTVADILQDGDLNEVDLNQYIFSGSSPTRAYIEQTGEENSITGEQTNKAIMDVFQDGDRNEVVLKQNTNYDRERAYIDQIGDDNLIELDQESASAWIEQDGNENVFRLEHNTVFPVQDGESEVYFTQDGDNNEFVGFDGESRTEWAYQNNSSYTGYQDGNNNVIGLNQKGNDNALITQEGDGNEAFLFQDDEEEGHSANIVQDGEGNSATVNQSN
ncbi:MAG: hypothetical protein ACOCV3_04195 [Halanaerobiales bacterium]